MSDDKKNNEMNCKLDISFPRGYGKYDNTKVGWLEKRSKFVKKWRKRFCVLKMSHCLMITYKYSFDDVTSISLLNNSKNQTDSIIFGDISCIQEIEFDIHGEEILYSRSDNKNVIKSTEYFGFKVFINKDEISDESILEHRCHSFECQYEGFELETIKYQKKDFDEYVFRCKNKISMQIWIDLISDCMIRAKYYNSNYLNNRLFSSLIFKGKEKDKEIKYYRLLLGLPHNRKITILWEKLGFALSQKKDGDINIFNQCCNSFETAHSLNIQDSKILYNFIIALDNFNDIDIFTKNRISKTLMIYNRIQKLYNNKSFDHYGFCKFLFENQLYKLLENVLNKLLINNIGATFDYFSQITYWTKLIFIYNIDDNYHLKWKYLLKIKKCYQLKAKQQDIKQWNISQIIQYIDILIQLKHYQQSLIYINIILQRNKDHIEANKLLKQIKDIQSDEKEEEEDDNDDDIINNNNNNHNDQLYDFLSNSNVDLLEYYDLFIDNNIENLNKILYLNKKQLIHIGIKDIEHQTKILDAIHNINAKNKTKTVHLP